MSRLHRECAECGRAVDPHAHRLTKDGRGVLCPQCAIEEEKVDALARARVAR